MNESQTNQNGVMWVIAIVVILALIIGWMAFNRSGDNLSTEISQEGSELGTETRENYNDVGNNIENSINSVSESAQDLQARAEVRTELLALQTRLSVEEGYDAAADEVKDIRANLAATYEGVEDSAKQNWQQLDIELDQLEQSIRTNSADALETLAGFMLNLEADVRVDSGENE
jgi:F0F1-type ATP synthase membrane subunit b/b'